MHRIVQLLPFLVVALAVMPVGAQLSSTRAQEATPAATCPATTAAENEATALRWHEEAINEGNLDVIDEIVTPDVIHHSGTFPDGVGSEAVKTVLGSLTAFPDVRHMIEQVIAAEEFVVTIWEAEGTQEGEF